MPTLERGWVVCGEHSLKYPSAGKCPDCDGTQPPGTAYTPNHYVEIVTTA